MEDPAVAYIELAFTTNENGHVGISRVCFLYENVETNDVCGREINELNSDKYRMDPKDDEPEYYILISDDEDESEEGCDEEVDEETDNISTGFEVEVNNCEKLPSENTPIEDLKVCPSDTAKVSTPPRKSPLPLTLSVVAIATLPHDKVVLVTLTGEVMIFDADFKFLFLRQFSYKFEDICFIDDKTLGMTGGFCIYFFNLGKSNVEELSERTIDLEYSGGTTVHSLEHCQSKLAVVCNIQRVNSMKNEPSVRFFDTKGHHLLTIPIPSLRNPCRMRCSSNGKLLFLCDSFSKRIVCLNDKGTILWDTADDRVPIDIVLARDSILYILYEDATEVVGVSMTSGKRKSKAEIPPALKPSSCRLEYQKEHKRLLVCREEICVGNPNIIYPLKTKNI